MPDSHTVIESDLVVAGGGLAGVCAAVRAARQGLKVVLVQDRSVLGGNASSEIRMHVVGADQHGARKGWRESGLMEEIRLSDAHRNSLRCYPLFDVLLWELVKNEPNITLLLDTAVIGAELEGGARPPSPKPRDDGLFEYKGPDGARIASVTAFRHITEDRFTLKAKFFADCTGDGRLGAEAGADHRIGREPASMLGENLAPDAGDPFTLGSSILLTTRKTDKPAPFIAPTWVRKFDPEMLKVGRPIHAWDYGFWWIEWGGHLNTLKDHSTVIRDELYAIALGVWNYVKNSGNYPESANWTLDWIGAVPGKRESRRFLGPHLLTQMDIQSSRRFPDAVAYGGWPIDLHPIRGIDAVDEPPYYPHPVPEVFQIPLRTYFSRNIENLFFAGRNISSSHVGFASTRVMATCAVGGEAVGYAAAECVKAGITPAKLVADQPRFAAMQQEMLNNDTTLPYVDRVASAKTREAKLSCSSSATGHGVELLRDGWTRDFLNPKTGEVVTPHSWRSSGLAPAGEWVELSWPVATDVSELRLTFDTGLSRELTLTASDWITSKMVRGAQPETVADYDVLADGKVVAEVRGNVHRFRTHKLAGSVKSVRVRFLSTHGVPEARLVAVEVR